MTLQNLPRRQRTQSVLVEYHIQVAFVHEVAGTYRAPDGTEAPSTVLIIVHAKDGTIHMYPGQPSKGG